MSGSGNQSQNIINHVALVLDASSSMYRLSQAVVRVADALIADLARQSQTAETHQETRVTVYVFADRVTCIIYDMDVLRLPSIAKHYVARGNTALAAATHLAIDDLRMTPEKYGDHSYLLYIITDGQENVSTFNQVQSLPAKLGSLPDHWTMAALVPSERDVTYATQLGFARGNVQVWDATSERGVEEAGRVIRQANQSFMTGRAAGRRGTKTLFQVDDSKMTLDEALKAGATLMDTTQYVIVPVYKRTSIAEMVKECTPNYRIGQAYYQLNDSDTPKGKRGIIIQGNKDIMVMENATKRVASGRVLRKVAGLPETDITVDPKNMGKENIVFVQSTSLNRILYPGTKLLLRVG